MCDVQPAHFLSVYVAGILVPQISVVFGLTGSLTAVNVMYVFPALFYLCLYRNGQAQSRKMLVMAIVIGVIGVCVCFMSTAGIIYNLVHGGSS